MNNLISGSDVTSKKPFFPIFLYCEANLGSTKEQNPAKEAYTSIAILEIAALAAGSAGTGDRPGGAGATFSRAGARMT